jgi:hypothetical protein
VLIDGLQVLQMVWCSIQHAFVVPVIGRFQSHNSSNKEQIKANFSCAMPTRQGLLKHASKNAAS